MSPYVVVLTTVASEEDAIRLAQAVIESRLAACVSIIGGVRSLYRFKGVVADDREHLLVMKTAAERYDELASAIAKLHPYEVPEILALPVARGSESYLSWVSESVKAPPDRSE
jgi:periplasmic divalent cation tolerance protein